MIINYATKVQKKSHIGKFLLTKYATFFVKLYYGTFSVPSLSFEDCFLFIELKINYLLRYSCIDLAALRPSDIAKITVAPPRTISPPANNIGIDDCI